MRLEISSLAAPGVMVGIFSRPAQGSSASATSLV